MSKLRKKTHLWSVLSTGAFVFITFYVLLSRRWPWRCLKQWSWANRQEHLVTGYSHMSDSYDYSVNKSAGGPPPLKLVFLFL